MAGTHSLNFDQVKSFQDYIASNSSQLVSRMFTQLKTPMCITNHAGVKGKMSLTELIIGDLVRRWRCKFDENDGVIDFVPSSLEVVRAKVDIALCPQDFECSFLGAARKPGQDAGDMPFEDFILSKIIAKVNQEIEYGIWQAKETATPATSDKLMQLFDGFFAQADTLQANGHPVYAGGILTVNNIIQVIEDMFCELDSAYQDVDEICAWVPSSIIKMYQRAYREKYGKYCCGGSTTDVTLDFAPNCKLKSKPGMGNSSQRIIITPSSNLHYAYDARDDKDTIYVQQDKRQLCFWLDFMIGVGFGLTDPGCFVMNELS